MTDPNYKDNLVRFFKSKGFKYKDIDAWMERNQIDKKINDAKAANYADLYYRAMASGNPITASAVLSQLAPINPQMASSIMATAPTWKEAWNVKNARENALTAYEMKQKADEANYKRQLARDRQQFEDKMKIAAYNAGLKLEEYKQRLGFGYNTIAQLQGTEAANQWLVDTLNRGSKGGSKGGSKEPNFKETEMKNKLAQAREDAYNAMGTEQELGESFTNQDNHAVEEYRVMLEDFKRSGYAKDQDDIDWANEELANLQNKYTRLSRIATAKEDK